MPNANLLQHLELDVLEFHDHAWVVELELDHAALEAFRLGEVFGEFAGKFAVNVELEVVALGYDVHLVPLAFFYVGYLEAVFDRDDRWPIVLADHENITPKTPMLATARCMKIPRTQYLPPNAHVTKVRMVTLEIAATCFVRDRTDAHTTITLAGEAVAELHFKVCDIFVFAVRQVAATFVSGAHDYAIFNLPSRGTLGWRGLPSIKGFAVKYANKTIFILLVIFRPNLE